MKSSLSFFVLSLLLFNTVFTAECEPGFVEDFEVLVMDSEPFAPIIGAKVNVTYQLDYTTGKGYFTTPNKYTDEKGLVSVRFGNQEQQENRVDCDVVIKVYYNGAYATETVVAQNHPNRITIELDIYDVSVTVTDQNEQPIENADVWVLDLNKTTNSNGKVDFRLGRGDYNLFVKYEDGKYEKPIRVRYDSEEKVGVSLYNLNIEVVDEFGKPLDAIITVGDDDYNVTGKLDIEELATASPYVRVKHGEKIEYLDIDLTIKSDYFVSFDLIPPEIVNVTSQIGDDEIDFDIEVYDPGEYSSKISSVRFFYKTSKGGPWVSATIFPKTPTTFGASIPPQPPGTDVFIMLKRSTAQKTKLCSKTQYQL